MKQAYFICFEPLTIGCVRLLFSNLFATLPKNPGVPKVYVPTAGLLVLPNSECKVSNNFSDLIEIWPLMLSDKAVKTIPFLSFEADDTSASSTLKFHDDKFKLVK
ncbi:hypothetical protein DID77_01705 [Candidatus Marinamargulisbacteria bacterium SCGC AG-439-L15]|nr:hypothetical protein DID77_01705 [Candidatus Marinamargulisbacteria bacterium SCGC AG-439-L15]